MRRLGLQGWGQLVAVMVSLSVLAVCAWGIYRTTRSPLFLVQAVEVSFFGLEGLLEDASLSPIKTEDVEKQAGIRTNQVSLFGISLEKIESRLLENPWIDSVSISKRFPQTLGISVRLRRPVALLQGKRGRLFYVDSQGNVFAPLDTRLISDLPVIAGIPVSEGAPAIKQLVKLIQSWFESPLGKMTRLSSLKWSHSRGYEALVLYEMIKNRRTVRTRLDLGQKVDVDATLPQLARVYDYLAQNSVAARRLLVAGSKKVVVKTRSGS